MLEADAKLAAEEERRHRTSRKKTTAVSATLKAARSRANRQRHHYRTNLIPKAQTLQLHRSGQKPHYYGRAAQEMEKEGFVQAYNAQEQPSTAEAQIIVAHETHASAAAIKGQLVPQIGRGHRKQSRPQARAGLQRDSGYLRSEPQSQSALQ